MAAAWRALYPDLAVAIDAGTVPGAVDPELALAGVYLLRPAEWASLATTLTDAVRRAGEQETARRADSALRAEVKAAREEADRLREMLDRERSKITELDEEISGLRRESRKLRSDADRARAAARAATERAATEREAARTQLREAEAAAREAADQARAATERAAQSRRAEREGRSLADTRVRLLLDTVLDAAAGLRRELALPPAELRPADLVVPAGPCRERPCPSAPGPGARRRPIPACWPSC